MYLYMCTYLTFSGNKIYTVNIINAKPHTGLVLSQFNSVLIGYFRYHNVKCIPPHTHTHIMGSCTSLILVLVVIPTIYKISLFCVYIFPSTLFSDFQ
jgi:hypothetical protein